MSCTPLDVFSSKFGILATLRGVCEYFRQHFRPLKELRRQLLCAENAVRPNKIEICAPQALLFFLGSVCMVETSAPKALDQK